MLKMTDKDKIKIDFAKRLSLFKTEFPELTIYEIEKLVEHSMCTNIKIDLSDLISWAKEKNKDFNIVIFGQNKPKNPINFGFPTYYLGQLKDSYSLKALYSASDILLVPSRIESFCNTACEAHACGIPVVSFKVGGLIDIVNHKKTGYLASPFDIKDFANGIIWILDQIIINNNLNRFARKKAVKNWDYSVVSKTYETLYEEIIFK